MALCRGEQRQHPRLYESFPVLARGVEAGGEACETGTVLDVFSAGGLSLRLPWRMAVGATLCAVVRLTTDPLSWAAAPCVAVHGVVRRVEPQPEGQWGVGVQCTHQHYFVDSPIIFIETTISIRCTLTRHVLLDCKDYG